MTLVFNASPLIILAKSGLLDCFLQLAKEVMIPSEVAGEIACSKDVRDPARRWVTHQTRLIQPITTISPFIMAWDLGAGESAVIALTAMHPGAVAVLDDLAGRRCAQALGLPIIGTLGLVLKAKRTGMIPSASEALDAITAAGLYISPHHLETIRLQAGE